MGIAIELNCIVDGKRRHLATLDFRVVPSVTVKLSGREQQVADLLKEHPHIADKQIADRLNISTRTARFHVHNLLLKCNAESRHQIIENLNSNGG